MSANRILPMVETSLALALALLAPVAMAEPTAPAGPAPMLEIQEATRDGGVVEEGTAIQYKFTVANRGKADLELTQVKPSCGCTVPHWDKVIPAGKEGVIEAEVRTTGFRGSILKHLTV